MRYYTSTKLLQNFYTYFYCIILDIYYNVVVLNIYIYTYEEIKIPYIGGCIESLLLQTFSIPQNLNYTEFLSIKNVEVSSRYSGQNLNLSHSLELLQEDVVLENTNFRGFLHVEVNYGGA